MTVEKCPVCGGNGLVPDGFYYQTSGNWPTSGTGGETCHSCGGKGYVVIPDSEDQATLWEKWFNPKKHWSLPVSPKSLEWEKKEAERTEASKSVRVRIIATVRLPHHSHRAFEKGMPRSIEDDKQLAELKEIVKEALGEKGNIEDLRIIRDEK